MNNIFYQFQNFPGELKLQLSLRWASLAFVQKHVNLKQLQCAYLSLLCSWISDVKQHFVWLTKDIEIVIVARVDDHIKYK